MKEQPIKVQQSCPDCGHHKCLSVWANGGSYCHSCGKAKGKKKEGYVNLHATSKQVVPYRGHSVDALKKYGVVLTVSDATGDILEAEYPYPVGRKFRIFPKGFRWENKPGDKNYLFGQDKFSSGSAKAITVTEGEEDAIAVYELLGSKYPSVSVQSSSSAARDCANQREYLEGFERIYLCFDNDEAGKKAVDSVSALFPYQRIYVVKKTKYKDANDYLLNNDAEEYRKVWWNAKRHDPENIISSFENLAEIFGKPRKQSIASFPFRGLQEATFGIRTGETYLFKALEGIGKTEVMGAIEYAVTKQTDFNIGVIHLEEDVQRTALRFVNYELQVPVHLEGTKDVSPEEVLAAFRKAVGRDNKVHFYEQGKNDSDIDAVLSSIRFMVASCQCKIVFLDHISRLVSGARVENERQELDRIATSLSKLALELDFALIMVTHVNDDGLTRGSRNISKEAWTVISMSRDKTNPDSRERNTTRFVIEKNRHASITGPAGEIYFDPVTFCLSDNLPASILLPQET